jgi:hypothetical protein
MSMGRWPLKYDTSFDLGIAILLIIVIGLAIYSWSKEQTKPADSGADRPPQLAASFIGGASKSSHGWDTAARIAS